MEINRADPPPDLYTIDGAVPGEVLEEYAAWVSRHPCHPGQLIAGTLERKSLSALDAATLFGIKCADLTEVLEGRAPITPELALRIEAAGWSKAANWMRLQSAYDLAQERLRLERTGAIPVAPEPLQASTLDPAVATLPID